MSAAIDLKLFDINAASPLQRIIVGILKLESKTISVRELITQRVTQEVEQFNSDLKALPYALVEPSVLEKRLNNTPKKTIQLKILKAEAQITKALASFESNGFFILFNDVQLEFLEDKIEITDNAEVSFFRLVPLVGG